MEPVLPWLPISSTQLTWILLLIGVAIAVWQSNYRYLAAAGIGAYGVTFAPEIKLAFTRAVAAGGTDGQWGLQVAIGAALAMMVLLAFVLLRHAFVRHQSRTEPRAPQPLDAPVRIVPSGRPAKAKNSTTRRSR